MNDVSATIIPFRPSLRLSRSVSWTIAGGELHLLYPLDEFHAYLKGVRGNEKLHVAYHIKLDIPALQTTFFLPEAIVVPARSLTFTDDIMVHITFNIRHILDAGPDWHPTPPTNPAA